MVFILLSGIISIYWHNIANIMWITFFIWLGDEFGLIWKFEMNPMIRKPISLPFYYDTRRSVVAFWLHFSCQMTPLSNPRSPTPRLLREQEICCWHEIWCDLWGWGIGCQCWNNTHCQPADLIVVLCQSFERSTFLTPIIGNEPICNQQAWYDGHYIIDSIALFCIVPFVFTENITSIFCKLN